MPLYEYRCTACATSVEMMQKVSDPPPTACEKCSGSMKKVISAPAFQFRGTGWYVTDYARKGKDEGQRSKSSSDSDNTAAPTDKGSDTEASTTTNSDKPPSPATTSSAAPAPTPAKSE